jgi:hypothetical protein
VVRLDGPPGVEIVSVSEPESGPGEFLVDVHATGLSYPDLLLSRGTYQLKPELPFTLGIDFAGVVRFGPAGHGLVAGTELRAGATVPGPAVGRVAAVGRIRRDGPRDRCGLPSGGACAGPGRPGPAPPDRQGRAVPGHRALVAQLRQSEAHSVGRRRHPVPVGVSEGPAWRSHGARGPRVFAHLSVRGSPKVGGFTNRSERQRQELIEQVYATFPHTEHLPVPAARRPQRGERQMLAFGRAMMAEPTAIPMDKPSMGLPPIIVDKVMDTIKDIAELAWDPDGGAERHGRTAIPSRAGGVRGRDQQLSDMMKAFMDERAASRAAEEQGCLRPTRPARSTRRDSRPGRSCTRTWRRPGGPPRARPPQRTGPRSPARTAVGAAHRAR